MTPPKPSVPSKPLPNPFAASAAWLGALCDAHRWMSPASAVVGSVLGGVFFSILEPWSILCGVGLVGLFATPEICSSWWRAEEEKANGNALAQQHLLMKNALNPMANLTAQMINQQGSTDAAFRQILQQAVGSCLLPFDNDLQVRALAFVVSDDGQKMICEAQFGRAQESKHFERGTKRGDKAFKVLEQRKTVNVPDLSKSTTPREWAGSGEGYSCFLSVPIYDSTGGFGLLSIDTPTVNSFGASHQSFVELVASMLAVAFADRSRTSTQAVTGSNERA